MDLNNISIVRKNIKHIYIKIRPDLKIVITAPYLTPTFYINYFIKKKKKWIDDKINFFKNKHFKIHSKNINTLQYFGTSYTLKIVKSKKEKIILKKKKFTLHTNQKENKQTIINNWYKQKAKKTLSLITKRYCIKTNQEINILRIRKMKTRWGSCNHKKKYINLNQELIKQPLNFIEYVVLHELAHLTHPNHSKDFYNYISSYMPDFKNRKKLIK